MHVRVFLKLKETRCIWTMESCPKHLTGSSQSSLSWGRTRSRSTLIIPGLGFGKLSFLLFKFGDRRLYGVQASSGMANVYYNYFYYVNTRFHYLGVFPELLYDKNHDLFVGGERDANEWVTTYFRLSHRVTLSPVPGP